MQERTTDFVTEKRLTEENLKKAFRSKLLEFCKTRIKEGKSWHVISYKVFPGHDMVTNAVKTITWRLKFKVPSLRTKGTKNEVTSENMGFNWKTIWRFQKKQKQKTLLASTKQPCETHGPLNTRTYDRPCNQEQINWGKIEESLRIKTVGILQDEN